MSLLAPFGLLALLTLPVIVVLHMVRSRRRRVVVPSLLLWQQIPLRPSTRRRRLRLTLLLLLHLIAALLIGLALAQPQIVLPWFGPHRSIAIIIDTSTSMALAEGGTTRLERARQRAATVIEQMGWQDRVVLISAGPSARLIDHDSAAERSRLLTALAGVRVEGTGSDVGGALTIAETLLLDQPGARVVWLTDGALPPPNTMDLRLPLQIEVLGTSQPNRAVVTLAAHRGSAGVYLYARLANYGTQSFRGPVRLLADDQLTQTETVSIQPNAAIELTWTLPGPAQQIQLEFAGNDGLPLDDTATVNVDSQRPARVTLVAQTASALVRVLQAMPDVTLTVVDPATYTPDPTTDVTIFINTVPTQWPGGGVLVINPPGSVLLPNTGTRLAEPVVTLTPAGESLLRDVNLSGIAWGQIGVLELPDWLTPLALSGDTPLLARGRFERSEIAVWNFDLNNSPLVGRLAFPLLVVRTVRDLMPPPLPPSLTLGTPLTYKADLRATHLDVQAPDGSRQTYPLQPAIPIIIEPEQVGLYHLYEWAGTQLLSETTIPVNAGAIGEADPTPRLTSTTLGPVATTPTAQPVTVPQPLWSWLLIATIIVLVVEWFYVQRRPSVEAR
ncbi:vWA domain-containing protein [Chloroflexus sp.]